MPATFFPPGFSEQPGQKRVLEMADLPPILRAVVATDGTVTRLLEAYFWKPLYVRVMRQDFIRADPFESGVEEEVVSREVMIGFPGGRVLLWAKSFILLRALEPSLVKALREESAEERIGIGALLRRGHVETYREHCSLEIKTAGELASKLETEPDDPVVERVYRVHRDQQPFIELTETFPVGAYAPMTTTVTTGG
jgi:chorismate-pyruvate lyase